MAQVIPGHVTLGGIEGAGLSVAVFVQKLQIKSFLCWSFLHVLSDGRMEAIFVGLCVADILFLFLLFKHMLPSFSSSFRLNCRQSGMMWLVEAVGVAGSGW